MRSVLLRLFGSISSLQLDLVETSGEMLALSAFPKEDPDSMDFLWEYGNEYEVLQIGNTISVEVVTYKFR